MKTLVQTLPASQVVGRLYAELGALRAWADFLSDNIRGKQNFNGLTLMPVARMKDARSFRPVYSVADLDEFIKNVNAIVAKPAKITPKVLAIENGRSWRVNKFDQEGLAIKLLAVRFAKTRRMIVSHC